MSATPPNTSPPTIVVLGADGQVGSEITPAMERVFGALIGPMVLWRRGDFYPLDPGEALDKLRPSVIINAAAYTRVDEAETNEREALEINGILPGLLGAWARRAGALVVHYSTDYVFDGLKTGAYIETDAPRPLSAYGRTKSSGDRALLESGCDALIFRTSWVFGQRGRNFPKTILELALAKDELTMNEDQMGAPTSAALIADLTVIAVVRWLAEPRSAPKGLYNLAARGETSWLGYAERLIGRARKLGWPIPPDRPILKPTSGPDPSRPAKRPLNSRLDCRKLERDLHVILPPWTRDVDRLVASLPVPAKGDQAKGDQAKGDPAKGDP